MKLIIKEYLSLLKESNELDTLIPELLFSMGHKVISKVQKGVRQYGVDIASVGIDNDGIEKVFLFTVKEGHVDRKDWDSGTAQAIRPSLEDIRETYIPTHIPKQYKNYPIKVVLATGGDLKQTMQLTWSQYTEKYSIENELEFIFLGGDELALYIEKYLFNENIFPDEIRGKLRKALALLNDTDYDLRDYYDFLSFILEDEKLPKLPQKKQLKSLRLIYLALNIIYSWSKEENNLKHALLASERTILNVWNYLYKNELTSKKALSDIIGKLYFKHINIVSEYCEKLAPAMRVKDGLSMYGHHFVQESKILFEQLGILAELGHLFYFTGLQNKNEEYLAYSQNIAVLLKKFIQNHKALYNPVYDEHIIDISLAILLLQLWHEIKFIDQWIGSLISHIQFAFNGQGKYFPIDSDNFDDLIELNLKDSENKEEYIRTSTMIPILAQWCVNLGLIESYKQIQYVTEEIYKNSTLQIWYPDENIENFMYTTNAGYKCGYAEAPIDIYPEVKDFANKMQDVHSSGNIIDIKELSCIKNGLFPLILISNRHFRMPVFPQLWNNKYE
jgi:hypothetical protein